MEKIITWIQEKRILCCFLVLTFLCGTFLSLYLMEVNAEEAYVCPKNLLEEKVDEEIENYVVDIKGAVLNPGVYRVSKNSIVNDIIVLAGGLKEDADTSNLNLSKSVSNEMIITVYTKEEINSQKKLEAITEEKNQEAKKEESDLVSLNTATLEELMTIPGIGEAKAKIIIQYRESCGAFKSIEELKNIKGIGEAVFEKLKAYITL